MLGWFARSQPLRFGPDLILHSVHPLDGGHSRAEQLTLIMRQWKWERTSLCRTPKPIWRLSPGL
jgi:hypothetical protein